MNEEVKLRRLIASEHGLDPKAASLLQGTTIHELDESAAELRRLIEERREPEQPQPPATIFDLAAAQKAERKRTLVDALCGRTPQQSRDEQGRYMRPATGFDGGVREPLPVAPESHEQTLTRVLRSGEANLGARF